MPDPQEMLLPDGRRLTLVHFAHRAGSAAYARWVVACVPNLDEQEPHRRAVPWHRSDDVRAVTCPACKGTEAFKEALQRLAR